MDRDPPEARRPGGGRRAFLRLVALAPAAACAHGSARAPVPAAPVPAAPAEGPARTSPLLEAVRSAPLPLDVRPALVFRAALSRPGE